MYIWAIHSIFLVGMNTNNKFTFLNRLKSLLYAINGIRIILTSQHNAWIHATASILAVAAGFFFKLNGYEWGWVVLCIMSVWTAEALNTAFEFLADAAQPEFHPLIEKAKDVAAGAVLITAIGSAIISMIIFGPHVIELF